MKVWPIDPLVPRNLRLEVPEKLPQGLTFTNISSPSGGESLGLLIQPPLVVLVYIVLGQVGDFLNFTPVKRLHTWMLERLVRSEVPKPSRETRWPKRQHVEMSRVTIFGIEIISR